MKRLAVLAAVALWAAACPAAEPAMVTRLYPMQPSFAELVSPNTGSASTNLAGGTFETLTVSQRDIQKFFEDMGVAFPPGSSIKYNPTISQIVLNNTPKNIEIFDEVLQSLNVVPNQVEIDVSFVSFELKLIEALARKSDRAAPTGEEIKALWREGKGKIAGTSKTVTRSGINAQVKGVEEVIYPTEFEGTADKKTPDEFQGLDVVPTSFETREVGVIQNVTPTVGPDGYTIDLTFVPELCEQLGWDDVGISKTQADGKTTAIHLRQPRFHSRNLTTSIVLWDGETIVAGAMPNRDGAEVTYVFISARLLDPTGAKIRKGETKGYVDLSPEQKPAVEKRK